MDKSCIHLQTAADGDDNDNENDDYDIDNKNDDYENENETDDYNIDNENENELTTSKLDLLSKRFLLPRLA